MNERLTVTPLRRVALWLAPVVLLLTVVIDRKAGGSAHGAALFVAATVSLAIVAGVYVLWQLPTVYMFSAGLVLSIFSGNWQYLGLPGFPFLPDRFLLVGSVLLLVVRERDQLSRFRVRPAHVLLGLTVLYAVVSAAADGSLGNRTATFALLDQLGAIPFFMFFAVPLIIRSEKERRVLLFVLVGLGLYLGIEAVLEGIGANALVLPHYIVNSNIGTVDGRVRGPFASSVTEGFALFGSVAAAGVALTMKPPRVIRLMAIALIPLCLLGCFLTLERGVWLAAVVSVFTVGLFTRELRRRLLPILLVAGALVLGALAFVPGLEHRAETRSQDSLSVWDRENQDAAAFRMIQARPLFGFGWDTFAKDGLPYFRQASSYPMVGYGIQLHDVYLSNAVELGLIGFTLWLLAQIMAFGSALTGRAPPELRPWKIALVALIVFSAVVAVLDPLAQNYAELLLWTWAGVIVGATANYATDSGTAPSPPRGRRMRAVFAMPQFAAPQAFEPWRPKVQPRAVALALSVTLVGAGIGFVIAHITNPSAPAFNQPVSAGSARISFPAGWHRLASRSVPALGLNDEIASRAATSGGVLVFGMRSTSDGSLLPQRFFARTAKAPVAQTVTLGQLRFYRYQDLSTLGAGTSVYALPTTVGTVVGVCMPRGAPSGFGSACERALGTVRLTSGRALRPGPNASYARGLDQVITRLNGVRFTAGALLRRAHSTAAQAAAATELASAHVQAAAALARLAPGVATPANSALAAALRMTGSAYEALARAAASKNARGYGQATASVQRATAVLNSALAQLTTQGYVVG